MSKVRISLVKGINGRKPSHIATVKSLGLNRMGKTVEQELTADIQGKIKLVSYLVKVEEV